MGDCFIMRHGGSVYRPPVLNDTFPQDCAITVQDGSPESAAFSVVIDKAGNPAFYEYQWYIDGIAVDGAVNPNLTLDDITDAAVRNVYCEVSNKGGTVVSRLATLYVSENDSPVLDTAYPADVSCDADGIATFQVKIIKHGTSPEYTYQWYLDDVAVEAATKSTFKVTNPTLGLHRVYCKVVSTAGTINSRVARLNVDTKILYSVTDGANDITGGFVYRMTESDGRVWEDDICESTLNRIDLTSFSKICFEGSMIDDDDPSEKNVAFCVWRYVTDETLVGIVSAIYGTHEDFTLDISDLSGKYYIGYWVYDSEYGSVDITKLYLKV